MTVGGSVLGTPSRAEAASTTVVAYGSWWKYRDNGVDPGTSWMSPQYDASSWKGGFAQMGYGDGDEKTVVGYGADPAKKFTTTWFIRQFNVANPAAFSSVLLSVVRDDGVRVYLNGTEVIRDNLPRGWVQPSTPAVSDGTSETIPVTRTLPGSVLWPGVNTLAVEVHQATPNSSDISFDLSLTGTPTESSVTLLAAGDLVYCGGWWSSEVANVVKNTPGTFAMLGDGVYPKGDLADYRNCYAPLYGSVWGRTKAAPGNHDYNDPKAAGYFAYFGSGAGSYLHSWYSYNLGNWHIVSLDSQCDQIGGCGTTSAQYKWLAADLAASNASCLAIYWHRPRYTSAAGVPNATDMAPMYDLAMREGADLLLSGHSHNYERFARLDAWGSANTKGIRQFVIGTGGAERYGFAGTAQPGSQVRNANNYGVLKLNLRSSGYDWSFLPIAGQSSSDSGSDTC